MGMEWRRLVNIVMKCYITDDIISGVYDAIWVGRLCFRTLIYFLQHYMYTHACLHLGRNASLIVYGERYMHKNVHM